MIVPDVVPNMLIVDESDGRIAVLELDIVGVMVDELVRVHDKVGVVVGVSGTKDALSDTLSDTWINCE